MEKTEKTPANENVWYLLATVYGESKDMAGIGNLAHNDYNNQDESKCHSDNRRIWNGWAGINLSDVTKKNWIKEFGREDTGAETIGIEMFDPWTDKEREAVSRRFESAGKTLSDVPAAHVSTKYNMLHHAPVIFRNISFPKLLNMRQYFLDMGVTATGAVFNGNVLFSHTNLGASSFANAHFNRRAYFSGSRIGIGSTGDSANFERATFKKGVLFNKAILSAAKFSKANFNETVDFTGAHFFAEPPIFNEIQLGGNINFPLNYNNWPDVTYLKNNKKSAYPKSWRNAYRALAAMTDSNMLPDETRFFVRQEFRCKRAVEESAGGRFLFGYYHFFSDYGQSVSKPFWALFSVWFVGAIAFFCYFSSCCPVAPLQDICGPIVAGMRTSFSNVFPLFGFEGRFFDVKISHDLPPCLKFLSGAQTVLSLPLIFLLGLGIRNRFRLR